MKPILKSSNIDFINSFDDFSPEISENFWCTVDMEIGPDDKEGSNIFQLYVGTTRAFNHRIQHEGSLWGRHYMVVNEYDGEKLRALIEQKIAECARPTFEETALVLSRYFYWEFEDYQV